MNLLPDGHPEIPAPKVGVLIINLGTPDDTDYFSMRRYLKQFLSDGRVIEVNKYLWWFLLNFVILSTRPQKSGEAYREIWNEDLNESPLRTITRSQATKLTERFARDRTNVIVDWAMRYGNPSIASRIDYLTSQGCRKILLFAMYPQYAAATSATAFDDAFSKLQKMRWQPAIRTSPPYHDNPKYIAALGEKIKSDLDLLGWKPDMLIASYHGVPKRYLLAGDPYHCHCQKTTRLLRDYLGEDFPEIKTTFQSLFGREEWLKPYTEPTLAELAQSGVKNIAVVMPGFSADCLETLEEIAIGGKETFLSNGGQQYHAIPCLNDLPLSIDLIESLCRNELQGWL